jgi:hypothetical protein
MKVLTVALALGVAVSLGAAAHASRHSRVANLVRVPVTKPSADPFWPVDYNIVPRYRYRPEDDRVDTSPYAKPIAPGEPEPGPLGPYTQ